MTKRSQISLPDDVAATLETLARDCSLPQSAVIAQLIRRYHPQLRELLSVDCNLLQPTATNQPLETHHSVERCIEVQPIATNGTKPSPPPRTRITGLD
jgi:hypothetical protein